MHLIFVLMFDFCQFTPMETSFEAEVPEITIAPNMMPLFKRQYDNNIFTGNTSCADIHFVMLHPDYITLELQNEHLNVLCFTRVEFLLVSYLLLPPGETNCSCKSVQSVVLGKTCSVVIFLKWLFVWWLHSNELHPLGLFNRCQVTRPSMLWSHPVPPGP